MTAGSETALPAGALAGRAGTAPVTLTAAELAAEIGCEVPRADRLLAVAVTMVARYAPAAPAEMANEAAARFAGYLCNSGYGGIARDDLGPMQVEYVTNHASAFRNSGAAMLLSPWKVRRAGVIG